MLTKNQVLDAIKKSLVLYKREILDNEYSTRKYVDDAIANASGGSGGTSGNCNLTDTLKSQYDAAYTHSQSAHAPSNAEANVQADWNVTDTSSDAYIKNKPTIQEADYSTTYTTIHTYPYSDLIVSESSVYISATTTGEFSIRLKEAPLQDQVVNLTCSDPNIMSISSNTLTFTSDNYNIPQTVTLTLSSLTADNDADQFIVSVSSEHYYKDVTFEYFAEGYKSNIITYDFFSEVADNTLTNNGTGGNKYNATINTSNGGTAEFTPNGLSLHGQAFVEIPWAADSTIGSWTIELVVSEIVYNNTTYGRVYRSDTDTPSLYFSKNYGWRVKVGATKALTDNSVDSSNPQYIVDKLITLKYNSINNTCYIKVGDGNTVSNTMSATNTAFYLGNNDSAKSYYFDTLTISEFRVYNYLK